MMNLIPNTQKKQMIRMFYFRLVILFLVIISISFLLLFVSTLPTYLLSSIKNNLASIKLETQKNEAMPIPDQETLAIIADLDHQLDVIENVQKNKFIFSEKVINSIIFKKIPEIKITQITYNHNIIEGQKINISGTAPSREVLLLFRKALEDDVIFKKVDLPISNFIKGRNIKFYLSLLPA